MSQPPTPFQLKVSASYSNQPPAATSASSSAPLAAPPPRPPPPPFPSLRPTSSLPHSPSSISQTSQPTNPGPSPYGDPASLLRVIPLANYAPTARVSQHIASHTTTFLPPSDPFALYPQHAQTFQRMDNPTSDQDWAMRRQGEARVAQMMQAGGQMYGSNLPPLPNPFGGPPLHSPPQPLPLPYAYMPNYLPSSNLPPTPTSMTDTPPHSAQSSADYFEDLVSSALARSQNEGDSSSFDQPTRNTVHPGHGRPTISRQMSKVFIAESPDPLALPGPSPSKKQKAGVKNGQETSPTLGVAPLPKPKQATASASSSLSSLPSSKSRPSIPTQIRPSTPRRDRVVVEIPARRSSVSSRASSYMQVDEDQSADELDWGEESYGAYEQGRGKSFRSPSTEYGAYSAAHRGTKSVRTGEKDLRTARQKFNTLIEDVFEASDALPAEPTEDDLRQNAFFDRLAKDGTTPLVSSDTVDKIARYVARLHSGKRGRKSATTQEDAWDEEALKRVFRLLERVMREAEGLDAFPSDMRAVVTDKDKVKKGKKGRKGKGSASPEGEESQEVTEGLTEEVERKGEYMLKVVAEAAGAVECCLIILDGEDLSKQLYSEDLMSLAVGLLRDQMSKVVFPIVEGMAGEKISSRFLSHLVQSENTSRQNKSLRMATFFTHPSLALIAQRTAVALPHLSSLVARPDISFSDGLVIQTVYLAISPLFVAESATAGKRVQKTAQSGWSVMKSLRLEALGCLRGAFAKYSDQRQWIIEEILSSLVKLPDQKAQSKFQVTNGTTMSTISALLLQLIQASAYGVSSRIMKLRASAIEVEMGGKEGAKERAKADETRLCSEVTESCYRSARVVAAYLLQKSGQSKASKSTVDTDFKGILDTLIEDLLLSLYRPEWPAAGLYLNVFSKLFIATLDDQSASAESTAMKSIALDHLGNIAARLKAFGIVKLDEELLSLDQIISTVQPDAVKPLVDAHMAVHSYLGVASREDGMFASARDLSLVNWATEIHAAVDKAQSVLVRLAEEKSEEAIEEREQLQVLVPALQEALASAWSGEENIFGISDPKQIESANSDSVRISRLRPLQSAFEPILGAILTAMDLGAVALRSKALKALGSIALVDPDILSLPHVRTAFENRLSDSSPAVRDAALDLVGKYVVQKPELGVDYYPQIATRAADTGLGVRKKVIKLLRDIFGKTQSNEIRVDSCCKMIELVDDDDDTVKDAAVKALVDMLYSTSHPATAALFVDIVGQYRSATVLLERALEAMAKLDAGQQAGRTIAIVDALVQRLVDATEQVDFDSVSHIRAISLLCASKADLIDPHKAGVLLNYLRPPANSDEQSSNELLLRTFRLSIPSMPKTASSFANELSIKLKPMIGKPSGGFAAVRETIGCFCAVVHYLTKDYAQLLTVLRACLNNVGKIKSMIVAKKAIPAQMAQALGLTMYIVALIAEHVNLDQVALEDEVVQLELNKIMKGPRLSDYLYDLFLSFTTMDVPQVAPILSLGCLFRTYPDLIMLEETADWMDQVFKTNDDENHTRLLGVIYEFLATEAKRKAAAGQLSKDITALIGNTSELSESGVSTALVQRNIDNILAGAKSHHPGTQNAALDVLAFTVNQGLYHPLQCLPILISLETNENVHLAERALELHATLHQKHSGLVNVRFLDFAKASYEYQRTITSEVSGHREGVALLAGWFGLIGEKRVWRMDFVKALGKAFEYDPERTTAIEVGFAHYVAENLAAFEYKQLEEVMMAVQQLSSVISTCTPLASTLEKAVIRDQADGTSLAGLMAIVEGSEGTDDDDDRVKAQPLIHASMIVSIALLTKNHLLGLYSLTEDKCLKQNMMKKTTLGDKPATRNTMAQLDLGRLTLIRGIETVGEFKEQQATFLGLLHEDGTVEMDD